MPVLSTSPCSRVPLQGRVVLKDQLSTIPRWGLWGCSGGERRDPQLPIHAMEPDINQNRN